MHIPRKRIHRDKWWPNIVLVLIAGAFFTGCHDSLDNPGDYAVWMRDPEHGLIQQREVNGIRMSMCYLAPEYLAFQELRSDATQRGAAYDSLLERYQDERVFLLEISSAGSTSNVMLREADDPEELLQRSMEMNFDLDQCITLRTAGGELKPSLTHFENPYGLGRSVKVMIAFGSNADPDLLKGPLDVVFTDRIFNTGINHFTFDAEALRSASEMFPPM